jgi:hypothetical protein
MRSALKLLENSKQSEDSEDAMRHEKVWQMMAALVAVLLGSLVFAGCNKGSGAGPTPSTPTVEIACNGQLSACAVDLWSRPTIKWTGNNVPSCTIKRGDETLANWGNAPSGERQLEPQMASGAVNYTAQCDTASAVVTVVVRSGVPANFQITNGVTGAPVTATVTTPVRDYPANGGSLTIDEAPARFDVAISASGYLTYETVATTVTQSVAASSARTGYIMWPLPTGGELMVKQAAYGDNSTSQVNPGLHPLRQLQYRTVTIIPSDELKANAVAMQKYRDAATMLTANTPVVWSVGDAPVSDTVPVRLEIRGNCGSAGATSRTINSLGQITGANVCFKAVLNATSDYTIRHELIHVLGMEHHSGVGLVGDGGTAAFVPSQNEADMLKMMYAVRLGTVFPYNDRSVVGSAVRIK